MNRLAGFAGLILTLLTCGFAWAQAEVTMTNSDPVVAVHSNFRGQAVTLFGTIDPPPGEAENYGVVVVVQGPSTDWVVREKQRQFGFVLNAASARYDRVPGYYGVFSSRPLAQLGLEELPQFDLEALAARQRIESGDQTFDSEFVQLMRAADRFSMAERGVVMLTPSAFSVRVPIASNATNGLYLARAFVVADGEIIGEGTSRYTVRTQGFERYVADLARSNPALYGFATILVALLTGWVGGVLFRR